MNTIRVARKVFVGWFDVIKKILQVFQNDQESADIMLRCSGKLRMEHVLPTPAFGIQSVDELSTCSTIWSIYWHCDFLLPFSEKPVPIAPRTCRRSFWTNRT